MITAVIVMGILCAGLIALLAYMSHAWEEERAYLLDRIQNPDLAARSHIVKSDPYEPSENNQEEEEAERAIALVGTIVHGEAESEA